MDLFVLNVLEHFVFDFSINFRCPLSLDFIFATLLDLNCVFFPLRLINVVKLFVDVHFRVESNLGVPGLLLNNLLLHALFGLQLVKQLAVVFLLDGKHFLCLILGFLDVF